MFVKAFSTQVYVPPFLNQLPLAEAITTGRAALLAETAGACPNTRAAVAAATPAAAPVRTKSRRVNRRFIGAASCLLLTANSTACRPPFASLRFPSMEYQGHVLSEKATTLPGEYYPSEAVFAAERERIFSRRWLCAGRSDAIGQPGDYVLFPAASESLIVARGRDGRARAFYNVCRHRGSRLREEPRGSDRGTIRCPYPAWCPGLGPTGAENGPAETALAPPSAADSMTDCRIWEKPHI